MQLDKVEFEVRHKPTLTISRRSGPGLKPYSYQDMVHHLTVVSCTEVVVPELITSYVDPAKSDAPCTSEQDFKD